MTHSDVVNCVVDSGELNQAIESAEAFDGADSCESALQRLRAALTTARKRLAELMQPLI